MGDWAVKVSPLPVFCWLSYWNVTLPACWRSLLQAGGTACWQKERQSIRGRREGRGGPPQWDHNWSETVGKQNTVLCWGHTHTPLRPPGSERIHLSIHPFTCPPINQFSNFPSIHQHIFLSIHLSTSICLSVCLYTSLYPSIYLPTFHPSF